METGSSENRETEGAPRRGSEPKKEAPVDANPESPQVTPSEENTLETCFSGSALTLSEATELTAHDRVRLILIAGDPESGKTSLLASLFQLFLKGPFAEFKFGGSRSLLGFDRRCFLARIDSGNTNHQFERTLHGSEQCLLHLRVTSQNREDYPKVKATDLLFSDLSGEEFRSAQDSLDACRGLRLLPNADRFVVLVDGEKIIDLKTRQTAKSSVRNILRSVLDSGSMSPWVPVEVLFTKWDLVEHADDDGRAVKFVDEIESDLRKLFESRLSVLHFNRVSPVPEKGEFKLGWGIESVFPNWVEDLPEHHFKFSPRQLLSVKTQFDEFGNRNSC